MRARFLEAIVVGTCGAASAALVQCASLTGLSEKDAGAADATSESGSVVDAGPDAEVGTRETGSPDATPDVRADGGNTEAGAEAGGSGSQVAVTCPGGPGRGIHGKIIFDAQTGPLNRDLFMIDPDGCNLVQLTNSPDIEEQPAVSPDGTQVAFRSNRGGGGYNVFVLTIASGKIDSYSQNLGDTGAVSSPTWAPDGMSLYCLHPAGIYQLTTTMLQLIADQPMDGKPAWAHLTDPANDVVQFTAMLDRQTTIERVTLENPSFAAPVVAPSGGATAAYPAVSADRTTLAYTERCAGETVDAITLVPVGMMTTACMGMRASTPAQGSFTHPTFGTNKLVIAASGGTPTSIVLVDLNAVGTTYVLPTAAMAPDAKNPTWSRN
jgi:hypothetical protein